MNNVSVYKDGFQQGNRITGGPCFALGDRVIFTYRNSNDRQLTYEIIEITLTSLFFSQAEWWELAGAARCLRSNPAVRGGDGKPGPGASRRQHRQALWSAGHQHHDPCPGCQREPWPALLGGTSSDQVSDDHLFDSIHFEQLHWVGKHVRLSQPSMRLTSLCCFRFLRLTRRRRPSFCSVGISFNISSDDVLKVFEHVRPVKKLSRRRPKCSLDW